MNTLVFNTHQIGASHLLVLTKSDLMDYEKTEKVRRDLIDHHLHKEAVVVLKTYLIGFLTSRCKAYEAKGYYYSTRTEKLMNLLQHVTTYNPRDPFKFYQFILKWKDLLLNSLPKKEDISHQKVKALLSYCQKHTGTPQILAS